MKLLTINTHSLQEENYPEKLAHFVEVILRESPDIIAMQEVSQTADAPLMAEDALTGQYPSAGRIPIRADNHAAQVARRLRDAGAACSWAWLPVKLGYEKYDEGVAILSLGRSIRTADRILISKSNDYANWQTRAALGVQVEGRSDWFYTVHMGWWGDEDECFENQWKKLNSCVATKRICGPVWLMGDFNAPDAVRGESYDTVAAAGWVDTYQTALYRDHGLTVPGVIDGWRDRLPADAQGMRLDYIWCSRETPILSSRVVFDGTTGAVISDHFGVMIETKEN